MIYFKRTNILLSLNRQYATWTIQLYVIEWKYWKLSICICAYDMISMLMWFILEDRWFYDFFNLPDSPLGLNYKFIDLACIK